MNGRGGRRGRDLPKLDQLKTADHPRHANKIHTALDYRIGPNRPLLPTFRLSRTFDFADNDIVTTVSRTFLHDH